ncbi:hypothetical protein [Streptomyces cinerochromogenes]
MTRTTNSLLHRDHRWIGRTVEDTATGRRGVLRAVARWRPTLFPRS